MLRSLLGLRCSNVLILARRGYFWFLVGLVFAFESCALRADTFVVLKGNVASLKAAINASNTNGQDDLIVLSGFSPYDLTTIDNGANGLPIITADGGHSVTISGHGGKIVRGSTGSPPQFRIFQIGQGANVTIENLTMSNGSVSVYNGGGGALYNYDGTVTLNNCVISGNSAIGPNGSASGPGGGAFGGGVYNEVGAITAIGCTFSGNSATGGNGAAGTNFDGGEAGGGAIYQASALTNCTFTSNSCTAGNGASASSGHNGGNGGSAIGGGAGFCYPLVGCSFSNNTVHGGTGGLIGSGVHPGTGGNAIGGAATFTGDVGEVDITDCSFDTNTATAGASSGGTSGTAEGGGMAVFSFGSSAPFVMSGCTFTGNVASSAAVARGGALCVAPLGGGVTGTLRNCTFSGNSAGLGGGIYGVNDNSQPPYLITLSLYNCTLSGNNASSPVGGGGFAMDGNSDILLANNILKKGSVGNNIEGNSVISQGHNISDDAGSNDLTGTGDLINTDPQLATAAPQDNGGPTRTIALLSTSPAIDHSDETHATRRDQRGYFRAGVSDTGAFEYQGGLIGRVTAIVRTGTNLNDITVSFEAVTRLTYTLQRKVNLTDASWQSIPNANPLTATGNDIESITSPNDASLDQLFYHVSYSSGP